MSWWPPLRLASHQESTWASSGCSAHCYHSAKMLIANSADPTGNVTGLADQLCMMHNTIVVKACENLVTASEAHS